MEEPCPTQEVGEGPVVLAAERVIIFDLSLADGSILKVNTAW